MNSIVLSSKLERVFFPVKIGGVEGHITLRTPEELASAFAPVAMETIFELRGCKVIRDKDAIASAIHDRARQKMPEEVRRVWFAYHYIQMRGEHRSADNPMYRGDSAAVLFGVVRTLEEAMRASMVLDGEPYPYHKWLYKTASKTGNGAIITSLVDQAIELIEQGVLRRVGDEATNPLSLLLRQIRSALIEAARAGGLDGPWLEKWWYHIDNSRTAIKTVCWGTRAS